MLTEGCVADKRGSQAVIPCRRGAGHDSLGGLVVVVVVVAVVVVVVVVVAAAVVVVVVLWMCAGGGAGGGDIDGGEVPFCSQPQGTLRTARQSGSCTAH